MEPVSVAFFASCHCGKENALDPLRNRPAPAVINHNAINFTNRCYFRSSPGEERFICGKQIFECHGACDNAMTKIVTVAH